MVGVDEHVDGEEEAVDRAGAVGVDEELGDGDLAAGSEGGEGLGNESAAAVYAFAVQDVAEGGELVAAAEIGFLQVAFAESEAIGEAEAGDGVAGNGQDSGPVNGGDGDVG